MGSELGFGRWPVGVVFKWVGMTKGLANLSSANPALWAMPGLNWRPLPCQGSALPLRQPPEVETGFEPVYTDLQSVASPLGHSTGELLLPNGVGETRSERTTGFEPATLTLAR